ncbi:hypothetical protein [Mucilaginibacter agri]|uniref:Uncharacterized protein n=1 Tax=Mucilaginibacter agri TaxID=2695265 RepID=A0A966DR28_9SPHI|nr:hypothetical protein [Mucilaginibacter agri]NCD68050.1 hypothetical protein [Mucilaginibacter agri]
MARKKRALPNKHRVVYYNRKVKPKPAWMRITRIIGMIIVVTALILAMIGMAMKYYHVVTKH